MAGLASPVKEATVLLAGTFLPSGANSSLGRVPAWKGMMGWKVELF